MSAFAKDPWGKRALSPRPSEQSFPVRRVGPRAADGSAAGEGGPPPTNSPGAGSSCVLTAEGLRTGRAERRDGPSASRASPDYCVLTFAVSEPVALLTKLCAAHHAIDEGELFSRLMARHADEIGIARLAEANSHNLRSREGREGVPSGALPLPQEDVVPSAAGPP